MAALRSIFWASHFIGLTVASFWLAWWVLTPMDFGYPWAYRLLDIDAHITEFAPQNLYKKGYELTREHERFTHFSAIISAINADGEGLADIAYQAPERFPETLLHQAEIIHLQDVAHLVNAFHIAAPLMLLAWAGTLAWARVNRWSMPGARQMATGGVAVLALCGVTTLLVGPTHLFYWLHTRIFPEDHQWFFYYQESLMTTLMKAPDLFGFIALLWVAVSAGVLCVLTIISRKMIP